MNFTVHYKFSSMMTKDEDQVEATEVLELFGPQIK